MTLIIPIRVKAFHHLSLNQKRENSSTMNKMATMVPNSKANNLMLINTEMKMMMMNKDSRMTMVTKEMKMAISSTKKGKSITIKMATKWIRRRLRLTWEHSRNRWINKKMNTGRKELNTDKMMKNIERESHSA